MGAFGALLTAFYMTRQVYYVFFGTSRLAAASDDDPQLAAHFEDPAHHISAHPHESPVVMTIPLTILAAFAIILGFIGTPAWPWFQSFLEGKPATFSFSGFSEPGIVPVMLSSSLIVLLGLGLGWYFYGRKPMESAEAPDAVGELVPHLFSVLGHAFYVDALYGATVIRLNTWWSKVCDWSDRWVWNGAVQIVSYLVVGVAWVDNFFDAGVINNSFDGGCESVSRGGQLLSLLQGGRVQGYLKVIGAALVALVIFLLWGAKA
jgi:NADH-quinone oxidoreductase subunit L